jgi:hypothetical protein
MQKVNSLSRGIAVLCLAYVLAVVFVPLLLGDVYPFTVAPMFRDTPQHYANYKVYAPDGTLLADNATRRVDPLNKPDPFLLRRYYDGNPVGYGVGICPPKTLDNFGHVPTESEVRTHIAVCLKNFPQYEYVTVQQEVVGATCAKCVGVRARDSRTWKVTRENDSHE